MAKIPDKPNYRPDELASAADVSVSTVERWMRKGLVFHIHIGRQARIPRDEFIRVMGGKFTFSGRGK